MMVSGSQDALTQTLSGVLFCFPSQQVQHFCKTWQQPGNIFPLQDKLPATVHVTIQLKRPQTDPKQELPTGSGGTQTAPTAVLESFGTLFP